MDTNNRPGSGMLQVNVTSSLGLFPVKGAKVTIAYTGNPESPIQVTQTDESGQIEPVTLETPPFAFSQEPEQPQPFSECTITIEADGYAPADISGVEVYADRLAIQNVKLYPLEISEQPQIVAIDVNILYGDYPPKIAEAEIKPINESGEIVLSRVVVPEYIVVHDGSPKDSAAKDYYVTYKDYIKNVASSEIYSTWPTETLKANILAIMSFTLNRVYTEWYRNKGYDFTITSSTAYDQKWTKDRTTFNTISAVVDELFTSYISRPNVKQPILTQYCDGKQVTCSTWLSQWGSKYLGDQSYTAIQILRYYYGSEVYINEADEISGIPASWPGVNLEIGSSGQKVLQMQEQLNRIAKNYPLIPKIAADGIYGEKTAEDVKVFQKIFGLTQTGVVDYATWYKISEIYVGVSQIAELNGKG